MTRCLLLAAVILLLPLRAAWGFDHQHASWDGLLEKHVVWLQGGHESRVNYAGFQSDRAKLQEYLASLSAVTEAEFDAWTKSQQLAFLINAYNAFTVELILTRYPDLESIKDLGSFLKSPWKIKFLTLLGDRRHLDYIEHDRIRAKGVYDDPRIHSSVVCASVGCPALRNEAFVAEQLDSQLEDNLVRFLSDKTRNRYNAQSKILEVSSIFDWYGEDFSQGFRGYASVPGFLGLYAKQLSDNPAQQARIRSQAVKIEFLDYDWSLNNLQNKQARLSLHSYSQRARR